MEDIKQTCGVCAYGDGKWDAPDRENLKKQMDLPTCELCKADGWISDPIEVQKAILEDPILKDLVEHQSPY